MSTINNNPYQMDDYAIPFPQEEPKQLSRAGRIWKVIKDFTVVNISKLIAFVGSFFVHSSLKLTHLPLSPPLTVGALKRELRADEALAHLTTMSKTLQSDLDNLKFDHIEGIDHLNRLMTTLYPLSNEANSVLSDSQSCTYLKKKEKYKQFFLARENVSTLIKGLHEKINKNKESLIVLIVRQLNLARTERGSLKEAQKKKDLELTSEHGLLNPLVRTSEGLKPNDSFKAVLKAMQTTVQVLSNLTRNNTLKTAVHKELIVRLSGDTQKILDEFPPLHPSPSAIILQPSVSISPPSPAIQRIPARSPYGFPNVGNSCYINAGLKLISPLIPQLIRKTLTIQRKASGALYDESAAQFKRRQNIQSSLRNVTEALQANKDAELLSALKQFRAAVFDSGLNAELVPNRLHGYSQQHDGAIFLRCILEALEYSTLRAQSVR